MSNKKSNSDSINLASLAYNTIVIHVEGGIVQEVYSNLAGMQVIILDKDQEDIGEPIRQTITEPEPLYLAPEEILRYL